MKFLKSSHGDCNKCSSPFQALSAPLSQKTVGGVLSGMRLELRTEKTNKTNKNVKDTLDIIVSDIAGERPIEIYSGGEKTRQVLALAVGLAELSARKAGVKISTLLIDEPSGLDRQGLVDFGNCFIKLASQIFRKGLLMAHEESLKDIFDQKLLVRKEGTTSKVEVLF